VSLSFYAPHIELEILFPNCSGVYSSKTDNATGQTNCVYQQSGKLVMSIELLRNSIMLRQR